LWLFSMKGRNLYELVEMSAQLVVDVLTAPDEPTLAAAWGVLAWAGAWAVIIAFCAAVATKYGSHIIAFCAAYATVATGGVLVAMLLLPLTIKLQTKLQSELQSAGMIGRDNSWRRLIRDDSEMLLLPLMFKLQSADMIYRDDSWRRLSRDDHLLIDKLMIEILACEAADAELVVVVTMSSFIVIWLSCSLGVVIFSRETTRFKVACVVIVAVMIACFKYIRVAVMLAAWCAPLLDRAAAHHMQLSANCEAAAAHAMLFSFNLKK
jgi:hypothetical protein